MPKRLIIPIGSVYNRLVIIKEIDPEIRYNKTKVTPLRRFECSCECGTIISARMSDLIRGDTKSCGCFKLKNILNRQKTHGLSKVTLYHIWSSMIQRCYNKNNKAYRNYGGRGIGVCDIWKDDFIEFYNWCINNRWEKGLEIDRFPDNNGNYNPLNCRITTPKLNSNNRRNNILVDLNGEIMTLTTACEKGGFNYKLINQRMKKMKISFKDAIEFSQKRKS